MVYSGLELPTSFILFSSCCLRASLTEIDHTTTTDGCGEKKHLQQFTQKTRKNYYALKYRLFKAEYAILHMDILFTKPSRYFFLRSIHEYLVNTTLFLRKLHNVCQSNKTGQ